MKSLLLDCDQNHIEGYSTEEKLHFQKEVPQKRIIQNTDFLLDLTQDNSLN
jgi:hypothetical protein